MKHHGTGSFGGYPELETYEELALGTAENLFSPRQHRLAFNVHYGNPSRYVNSYSFTAVSKSQLLAKRTELDIV